MLTVSEAAAFWVILPAGGLMLLAYFYPWLWRQYVMKTVAQRLRAKRILSLTYDDGPSEGLTPRILDLLGQYNAKATFFVVGQRARQHPEILDRIVKEGHEIGCHSENHLNAWKVLPWNAITDIDRGFKSLSQWLPSDGKFRPPHGKMTLPTYLSICKRMSSTWWWTVDSGDTHKTLPNPELVEKAILDARGGIVLLHDLHWRDRTRERDEFVLETTKMLLESAKRNSLKIATLDRILS